MKVQLGDLATWITGLATAGALLIAFLQINQERNRRYRTEQNKVEKQKISQAEKISAWVRGENKTTTSVVLSNQSQDPVYFAVVSIIAFSGSKRENPRAIPIDRFCVQLIPPGTLVSKRDRAGYSDLAMSPAVEIAFIDRAGRYWVRHATGELEEIQSHPMVHYQLPLEQAWVFPSDLGD